METQLPFLFTGICPVVGKFAGCGEEETHRNRKARDPLTLCGQECEARRQLCLHGGCTCSPLMPTAYQTGGFFHLSSSLPKGLPVVPWLQASRKLPLVAVPSIAHLSHGLKEGEAVCRTG